MMNDLPRQKLCEIIAQYDVSVIDDARRCEGLLRDFCGGYKAEVHVLINVLKEGVVKELLTSQQTLPSQILLTRLTKKVRENLALTDEAARWGVESWALALGFALNAVNSKPSNSNELTGFSVLSELPATTNFSKLDKLNLQLSDQAFPQFGAETVYVLTPEGQWNPIGDAINRANPGARIIVNPGIYTESIHIDKPVEIVGNGKPNEIIIKSKSSVLSMETDCAKVRGLTLLGESGKKWREYFAVYIPQGQLIMEDCVITNDSLSCIGIHGSTTKSIIKNCSIVNGKQNGVVIWDEACAIVEDSHIRNNAYSGIAIFQKGMANVHRCLINQNNIGIYLCENSVAKIEDNDITKNVNGSRYTEDGCKVMWSRNKE